MRGAYLARLDLDAPHLAGVAEKIRAQIAALEDLPATVDLYHCSRGRILKNGNELEAFGDGGIRRRLVHFFLFYRSMAKRLDGMDFVYIRYQGCSSSLLRMLSSIRGNNPHARIILELPSWPYHTEATTLREKLLGLVDRLTRRGLRHHIDRILTYARQDEILGIPTLRTQNGVDVSRLPLRDPPPRMREIRLIGVANLSKWHGFDRIIAGLVDYHRRSNGRRVHFDVVGAGAELARLKAQVEQGGIADIVSFHGPVCGRQLDALFANGNIGISSIGMHRLDVDTTNLKSREYCARGIPFIIGYPDADFPDSLPFVFHVPANDEAVDIGALVDFHDSLESAAVVTATEMRRYAERNLTWKAKMQPAIDYLRERPGNGAQG